MGCIFTPKMNVLGVLFIDDCSILVQSDLALAASINTTFFFFLRNKYKYNLFLYFCKVGYYFTLKPVANLQSISTGSMVVIPRLHIT